MKKVTTEQLARPESIDVDPEVIAFRKQFEAVSSLDELVRLGAQQMLQSAIEAEVEGFVFQHADRVDDQGRRLVVRNGYLPSRNLQTIRLRQRRTKGCGSRNASLAMMFKLGKSAEKRWRRLNGYQKIIPLIQGFKFTDGIMQDAA